MTDARKMTPEGISRAAGSLGCEVAAVRAVLSVEAGGSGFQADGRPKILFERHVFARLSGHKFDQTHPEISNGKPGGYKGGEAEYSRLYEAVQLDGEAAVQSASWGIAQIMGYNWKECGERSLFGFLLAVHDNEDSQLGLMAGFIKSKGLDAALRSKDWIAFAKGYNGPGYAANHYDSKLEAAYSAAKVG